jgi:6-phosphogluconate dehydrogenase
MKRRFDLEEAKTVSRYELGMIGLGVMGRNLLLNMADHRFPVAGYDRDPAKVEAFLKEGANHDVSGSSELPAFIALLKKPRAVMMLVPAGSAVDSVINELLPLMDPGDLIIDAGNSDYKDTDIREKALYAKGIWFMGMGVSGGEKGARYGPSIMPGGRPEAYERVRSILEASSAKVNGEPCVTHVGPGSAGHFVKMVHNGIEYALMQLISESYDLMKRGLGLGNRELESVYKDWNGKELSGYLMEITGDIFGRKDPETKKDLIDEIKGAAAQKGTGMWTSESAMELSVPTPTIDVAVAMRNLSVLGDERATASLNFPRPVSVYKGDSDEFVKKLKSAMYGSMLLIYSQGISLLSVASSHHGYGLDLEAIARIWRGGCIIRAAILEDIRTVYRRSPSLPNLLLDPVFSKIVFEHQENVRWVATESIKIGIPVSAFLSTLSYFDAYRSEWLPSNLIQAQRDFFGSHTYERTDRKGVFHTDWDES